MQFNTFLFTLVFLGTCLTGYSQSKYDVERRHSIDPIISYYRGASILEIRNDIERPISANVDNSKIIDFIRIGAKYNYQITPSIIIASGLIYNHPLIYIRKTPITSKTVTQTKSWRNIGQSYIEVPLTFRYVYTKNWCKSFLEISPMLQYLTDKGTNNPFQKAVNVAIGAEFNLGGRVTNFVQLNGYSQISKVYQDLFTDQLIGMGVSFGCRIHL